MYIKYKILIIKETVIIIYKNFKNINYYYNDRIKLIREAK